METLYSWLPKSQQNKTKTKGSNFQGYPFIFRVLVILGCFSAILQREKTFVTSCLLYSIPNPCHSGVYSKLKAFGPEGQMILSFDK